MDHSLKWTKIEIWDAIHLIISGPVPLLKVNDYCSGLLDTNGAIFQCIPRHKSDKSAGDGEEFDLSYSDISAHAQEK